MQALRQRIVCSILGIVLCGGIGILGAAAPATSAMPTAAGMNMPIGVIDFKACVEKSRAGRQEQGNFDNLKRQVDASLQKQQQELQKKQAELEKKQEELLEIKAKLEDPDYMDSLPAVNAAELKHKFRKLGETLSMQAQEHYAQEQELYQQKEEGYGVLTQMNAKAVQKLQEMVEKAAETIAKQEGLMVLANREAFFYYAPQLDKTDLVVALLDKQTAQEPAQTPAKAPDTRSKN